MHGDCLKKNGIERSLDEVRSFVEQQRESAEEELRRLFYDESYFFGRDKLYHLARQRDVKISRSQVTRWLQRQEIYQLHRRPKYIRITIQSTLRREACRTRQFTHVRAHPSLRAQRKVLST